MTIRHVIAKCRRYRGDLNKRGKGNVTALVQINCATLVVLLLAWHSPQAVSAHASFVGCHGPKGSRNDETADFSLTLRNDKIYRFFVKAMPFLRMTEEKPSE
jgi:hypothetical protein